MVRFITKILIIYFSLIIPSFSEKIQAFDFSKEEFETLEIKKVKKLTTYSLGSNENGKFLKAEAQGVGSGLGKKLKINIEKTPFINITWKIEKDLRGINENSKKGHDYAARVFVIKKTGLTALSNKAINYVFSSNNNIDEHWRSPYTKSSIDYVLSTTKEHTNEWVTVKANVRDHFKKLHGLDVKVIDGLAIMTDTDNSKLKAISYYQDIFFSSE